MSNLSDKEIDRLSREAADSYEPDDSSLSWSRLEQKLDQTMPERPPDSFRFGRMNPYVWGPAVILLAGASFFTIKNIHYSQHSTPNIQTIIPSVSVPDANSKNASGNTIHLDSAAAIQNETLEKIFIRQQQIRKTGSLQNRVLMPMPENYPVQFQIIHMRIQMKVSGYKQTNKRNSASNVFKPGAVVVCRLFCKQSRSFR